MNDVSFHEGMARAKINLFLHVLGRRDDGLHQLDSLVVFADVGDHVHVTRQHGPCTLSISGPFAGGLVAHEDNLVLKAAAALQKKSGTSQGGTSQGAHIVLTKNLPIASGIGGGSADAACTLRLLKDLWALDASLLPELALPLGADVPVCLAQETVRMQGIGERLTPAPPLPHGGILLVNPGIAVSTPAVFKHFTTSDTPNAALVEGFPEQWSDMRQLVDYLGDTRNDLQPSAIVLEAVIQETIEAITRLPGCLLARMSGSGATCFGLFESPDKAETAADRLRAQSHCQRLWWIWGGAFASCARH